MSKTLKRTVVKGAAAMAVGFAVVIGATHLLGSDRGEEIAAADMGAVTLASAQMGGLSAPDPAPQLPAAALTPGKTLEPAIEIAAPAPEATQAADCTATLDAMLMEGAMVRLTVNAPCDASARVQIRHETLIFDIQTDANGAVSVDMPALAPIAMFEADVAGLPLRAIAAIPDFESYTRIALQWQGQTGLQIHALEFGADIGTDGHVWADAPGTSLRAVRARGGFITRLGDSTLTDGHAAEVYVFPVGTIQRDGTVRLSVEAEVNAFTCGKPVEGKVLQPGAGGQMQSTALTLEIPDCDAIGDILVLKNLLRDMKIASN